MFPKVLTPAFAVQGFAYAWPSRDTTRAWHGVELLGWGGHPMGETEKGSLKAGSAEHIGLC